MTTAWDATRTREYALQIRQRLFQLCLALGFFLVKTGLHELLVDF